MSQFKILDIMSDPYQVNTSWVVDVEVKTSIGIEYTHIFYESYEQALDLKIDEFNSFL